MLVSRLACVCWVWALSLSLRTTAAHTHHQGAGLHRKKLARVSTMRPHGALTTALGPLPAGISAAVPSGCRNQPCAWLNFSGGVAPIGTTAGELRDQTKLSMRAAGQARRSPWLAATSTRSPAATPACAVGRRRQRPAALPRCASLAFEVEGDKVLPQDARDALAQGDVYKALLLLEELPVGRTAAAAAAAAGTSTDPEDGDGTKLAGGGGTAYPSSPSLPPTAAVETSAAEASAATSATATAPTASPRAAHARLIQLLWRAGHENEAVEAFDLARSRAREAATASHRQQQQQAPPSSSLRANGDQPPPPPPPSPQPAAGVNGATTPAPPRAARRQERLPAGTKHGAGIPGLYLDLDPDTCHGIMRRKMAAQDYLGVIEAMRAASRVPRRKPAGGAGGGTEDGGGNEAGVGTGMGWVPTEETYGLALEACGKVRARNKRE